MWKEPFPGNSRKVGRADERRLVAALLATLRRVLPSDWSVELTDRSDASAPTSNKGAPDAIITVRAPDATTATVIVEAKVRFEPSHVRSIESQILQLQAERGAQASLIVAPFLSPRARELLVESGLSYADSTGNLRLVLVRPSVFIERVGASSDPGALSPSRPIRSLKGPAASRVVRALCDFRPPFGVQQLAERSGTSLASVARVFAFLELDALIERQRLGPVTDVKWPELLRRWTVDYDFSRANGIHTFIEPRGHSTLLEKLRGVSWSYAITGSLAAADLAPIAASRLIAIYVDDAHDVADRLRLRPTEASANVILAEPFDPVVYDRTREVQGLRFAAPSQVAADLLTSPGRSPAEGEALIQWMREREDAWRQ